MLCFYQRSSLEPLKLTKRLLLDQECDRLPHLLLLLPFHPLLFLICGDLFALSTGCYIRKVVNASFGVLIAFLSVPVVVNLLSSQQIMNTSFNSLRIVNTYGAFGR